MIEVLLVEDDAADIELTQEAINSLNFELNLTVVRDGIEAMAYLRRRGDYRDAQIPKLILLDLNMPRMDGREVLQEIRADDALKHLPVIVLTTSQADEDIVSSYRVGVNAFITKPIGLEGLIKITQRLSAFYLNSAQLPNL
ncbi:response regulator [Acaryochloris marina NIES-2412]|uniref:response regulator n=1 Tax=Acaryochloris marina TaxID=155978 RepID=UPI004058E685